MHEKILEPRGFARLDLDRPAETRPTTRTSPALDDALALELVQRLSRAADPVASLRSLQARDPSMARAALDAVARHRGRQAAEQLARAVEGDTAPRSRRPRTRVRPVLEDALRAPTSPLPGRSDLERFFGQDLGDVQVHRGAQARTAARALGADAFALGNHIVLGDAEPTPQLIAEEVAHTRQQRRAALPALDDIGRFDFDTVDVTERHDAVERQARTTAAAFAAGHAAPGLSDHGLAIMRSESGTAETTPAAELTLDLLGKPIDLDLADLANASISIDKYRNHIPGLVAERFVPLSPELASGNLAGTLEGRLDLPPHLTAPVELTVAADGTVAVDFATRLTIDGLVDAALEGTLTADGPTGSVEVTAEALSLELDGATLVSGALTFTLDADATIRAAGKLVLAVAPIGQVELEARIELPRGVAFDGSQLTGAVTTSIIEPMPVTDGVEIGAAQLVGFWSGRTFTANGSLDVEVAGSFGASAAEAAAMADATELTATASVFGSYIWSPERKAFCGMGVLAQGAPIALGDDARVEGARMRVFIADDRVIELSGSARLAVGDTLTGELKGAYDVPGRALSGVASVDLLDTIELPGGLQLLGSATTDQAGQLSAVVVANELVQLIGSMRLRMPVPGTEAIAELQGDSAMLDLKRDRVSGVFSLEIVDEALRIGSADGVHLLIEPGTTARATIADNALVDLDSALHFAVRQGEASIAHGTIHLTIDDEGPGGHGELTLDAPLVLPGVGGPLELGGSGQTLTFKAARAWLESLEFPELEVSLSSLIGLLDALSGGGIDTLVGGGDWQRPSLGLRWPAMPSLGGGVTATDASDPAGGSPLAGLIEALSGLTGRLRGMWRLPGGSHGGGGDMGGHGGIDLDGPLELLESIRLPVPGLGPVRFGDGSPFALDLSVLDSAFRKLGGAMPFAFDLTVPGTRQSIPVKGSFDGQLLEAGKDGPWGEATVWLERDVPIAIGARDQLVLRGGEGGARLSLRVDASGPGPVQIDVPVSYLRDGEPLFAGKTRGLELDLGAGELNGAVSVWNARPLATTLDGGWRLAIGTGMASVTLNVAKNDLDALTDGALHGTALLADVPVAHVVLSRVTLPLGKSAVTRKDAATGDAVEIDGLTGAVALMLAQPHPLVAGPTLAVDILTGSLIGTIIDGKVTSLAAALTTEVTRDGTALGRGQARGTVRLASSGSASGGTARSGAPNTTTDKPGGLDYQGEVSFELTDDLALHGAETDADGLSGWMATVMRGSRVELEVGNQTRDEDAAPLGRPHVDLSAVFFRDGAPVAGGLLEGTFGFTAASPFEGTATVTVTARTPWTGLDLPAGDEVFIEPMTTLSATLDAGRLDAFGVTGTLTLTRGGDPMVALDAGGVHWSRAAGFDGDGSLAMRQLRPVELFAYSDEAADWRVVSHSANATVTATGRKLTDVGGQFLVSLERGADTVVSGWFGASWALDRELDRGVVDATGLAMLMSPQTVDLAGGLSVELHPWLRGLFEIADSRFVGVHGATGSATLREGETALATLDFDDVTWAGEDGAERALSGSAGVTLETELALPAVGDWQATLQRDSELTVTMADSDVESVGGTLFVGLVDGATSVLTATVEAERAPVTFAATDSAPAHTRPVLDGTVSVVFADDFSVRLTSLARLDGAEVWLEGGACGSVTFSDGRIVGLGGGLALSLRAAGGQKRLATVTCEDVSIPTGVAAGADPDEDRGISGRFTVTLEAERLALGTHGEGDHEMRFALLEGSAGTFELANGDLTAIEADAMTFEADVPTTTGRVVLHGALTGRYDIDKGLQGAELVASIASGFIQVALPTVPFPDAEAPLQLAVRADATASLTVTFDTEGELEGVSPAGPIGLVFGGQSTQIVMGRARKDENKIERKGGGWSVSSLGLSFDWLEALVGHALRLGDWLSAKVTGLLGLLIEGGESAWQWVVGLLRFERDDERRQKPEEEEGGDGWRVVLDLLARIRDAVLEGARVALGSLSDAASGALARISGLLRSVFDDLGRFELGGGNKQQPPRKPREQPRRGGRLPQIGWPDLALDLLGGFVAGQVEDTSLDALSAGLEAQLLAGDAPVATGNLVGHYDVDAGTFEGTLSLTTRARYVMPLGDGAVDAGLLSGLAIVVEPGQGLTLNVDKNALTSVTTGLHAALYDGDVAVGTLDLQGAYDFGTPEAGYHGTATVSMTDHVPLSAVTLASQDYLVRLSGSSGGQLTFAGTALTAASGTLQLDLVRGDTVAATLAVLGSYTDGRFQGELGLDVEDGLFLGEYAGMLLTLTEATGATVRLDADGAVEQIAGAVDLSVVDAASELRLATVSVAMDPWAPGQGVGPSGVGGIELAPNLDLTPEALRQQGLGLFVRQAGGVVTMTDGALTDVHVAAQASLYDARGAGQIDLDGSLRWTPGTDDSLAVTAEVSVPTTFRLPAALGGDLVPDHALWLSERSGGSLSWSPAAGLSLDGQVVVELERLAGAGARGRWLEISLDGGLHAAAGGSALEVGARLLKDMPVGAPVSVGKETWSAWLLASDAAFQATMLNGELMAAHGTLSVGVDDGLGRLFQASSGVDWEARGGEPSLRIEPVALQVLRDKYLGEVGDYALQLSKETAATLELDGVVPRSLEGAVVLRIDQPPGRKLATLRLTQSQRLVLGETPALDGELEVELHRALPAVGKRGDARWIELQPASAVKMRFEQSMPTAVTGTLDARYGEGDRAILGGELEGDVGLSGAAVDLAVSGKATLLTDLKVAETTLGEIKLRRGTEAAVKLGAGGLEALQGTVHLGVFEPGNPDVERARISLEDASYTPGEGDADALIKGTGRLTVNTSLPIVSTAARRIELRPGTSLAVPMENGVPTSVHGTLAFVYSDVANEGEGLTPLLRGEAEGRLDLTADDSLTVDGSITLSRALEMTAGDATTIVVQAGTRGAAHLAASELQSLEGTLRAEIVRQQPTGAPVVVSVEASGRYEHPRRELVHAQGSAQMTRGALVFYDDHLHVTELGGSFVWREGRLERLGGQASFGVVISGATAQARTSDGRGAAGQAFTEMTGTGRVLWRHGDDGRGRVSGDGKLEIERPGVLTAGIAARFEDDGSFDLTGHGHYWLNDVFHGGIGVHVDEQWDPVLEGELTLEDVELIGEHELFKIYRPQLFVLSATAAVGPVPVTGSLGIGAGARLVTKPLLASGSIGVEDFRPMTSVAPALDAELGLSTGLALETDLVVWADGGIGVPGASVKLRLTGGLSVTVNADLGLGMSVATDPSTGAVGGAVAVEAGLGVDAAARLVPSVVLELGKAFEHELTQFDIDLGQLFSVDWQGVYPWGDLDHATAPAPQPTAVANTTRQGQQAVQGDGEKQELAALSDYKGAPVDGTREGGPKLGTDDDAPAPPVGDEGFDAGALGESFGEYAAWIKLAKNVVDLVGTFMDLWNAGGTFEPFAALLPPNLKSITALGYFAWKLATGELDLTRDIVNPMKAVWEAIETLGLLDKLKDLFVGGLVDLVEWFQSIDLGAMIQNLIGWIQNWAIELAGDNAHFREAVRLIFEQIAEAQDTIKHLISLIESGDLTWDIVEELADKVVDSADVLAEIGYHVAMGTGQAIADGVEWVGGKLTDAGEAIGGAAEDAFNVVAGREKLLSPELLAQIEAQAEAAKERGDG